MPAPPPPKAEAVVEPEPEHQLRDERHDAGNDDGDDHHAYVAVTNVREFVAEYRLDLGIVKTPDQGRRDGYRVLLVVHAGRECVERVRLDHLELGHGDAARDAKIFQNIEKPRRFRARDLASAGHSVNQALMEEIGDDDPTDRAERS